MTLLKFIKKITKQLKVISQNFSNKTKRCKLIPGKKIDTASPSTEDQPQTSTTFLDSETDLQLLNKSLSIIGELLVKQ